MKPKLLYTDLDLELFEEHLQKQHNKPQLLEIYNILKMHNSSYLILQKMMVKGDLFKQLDPVQKFPESQV